MYKRTSLIFLNILYKYYTGLFYVLNRILTCTAEGLQMLYYIELLLTGGLQIYNQSSLCSYIWWAILNSQDAGKMKNDRRHDKTLREQLNRVKCCCGLMRPTLQRTLMSSASWKADKTIHGLEAMHTSTKTTGHLRD